MLVNLLSIEYAIVVRPIPSTLTRLTKWEKKVQGEFVTQIKAFATSGTSEDLEKVEDLGIQHAVVAGFRDDLDEFHGGFRSNISLNIVTLGAIWVSYFIYDGLNLQTQGLALFLVGGLLFACFWSFYNHISGFLELKGKIIFKHI